MTDLQECNRVTLPKPLVVNEEALIEMKWLRRRDEKISKACKNCQLKAIIEACERCVDEEENGDIIGGEVV